MRRYPIALSEFGVKPKDEDDYQGAFRIGYNELENALYGAMEVQDELIIDLAIFNYCGFFSNIHFYFYLFIIEDIEPATVPSLDASNKQHIPN